MPIATDFPLSTAELHQFHTQGYLGPYAACTPDEMAIHRARIEKEVLATDGPNQRNRLQCRHLDNRLVYDLVTSKPVLDRMRQLYGDDLVLWASYFFNKEPGGSEIPWHQDLNYWPLEPVVNISAWMAIDDVTQENSCVNIIPGSHKKVIPHIKSADGMAFGEMADMSGIDMSKLIPMILKPGEFFLFNEKLLHQSNKNISNKRRLGLTCRVTVPFVKLEHDNPPLFPGHEVLLISGQDKLGFNRVGKPPVA
jgi:ectoine hydroxylase-related dioxygenase (phytanoyl-CoA dioxygenase family)